MEESVKSRLEPSAQVSLNKNKNKIRGLGFKFVDFLYKSSDVCPTEIKMISSENIFFYLSYKLLSIALLIIVSTQK